MRASSGRDEIGPCKRERLKEAEPAIYALLRDIWEAPPKEKP